MGSFYPLVELARKDDLEMGPYPIGFVFGIAVFCSTIVFNFFFTNLPIQGQPIAIMSYFNGTRKQHLLGIFGGLVWSTGAIANFVAATAPKEVQVGPAISYALGQGACLVSTLWGLLYWKEFAGAPDRSRILMGVTVALYVIGLSLISLAPLYATK
jgi:glucose uptake protein